jgi:hypothetical protein
VVERAILIVFDNPSHRVKDEDVWPARYPDIQTSKRMNGGPMTKIVELSDEQSSVLISLADRQQMLLRDLSSFSPPLLHAVAAMQSIVTVLRNAPTKAVTTIDPDEQLTSLRLAINQAPGLVWIDGQVDKLKLNLSVRIRPLDGILNEDYRAVKSLLRDIRSQGGVSTLPRDEAGLLVCMDSPYVTLFEIQISLTEVATVLTKVRVFTDLAPSERRILGKAAAQK